MGSRSQNINFDNKLEWGGAAHLTVESSASRLYGTWSEKKSSAVYSPHNMDSLKGAEFTRKRKFS